jgi:hypothetical protein
MLINLTWKEHGQNFAGAYDSNSVDAQFIDLVVRTDAGIVTVPYKCMTSAKVDGETIEVLNQAGFATAIGSELPEDDSSEDSSSSVEAELDVNGENGQGDI